MNDPHWELPSQCGLLAAAIFAAPEIATSVAVLTMTKSTSGEPSTALNA
jgi:hypothetical protein